MIVLTITNIPIRPFDYSAKDRREYQLPICHPGEDTVDTANTSSGPESNTDLGQNAASTAVGSTSLHSLFGRQVTDDYTCAPDRPCANKACCPRATLSCNYGEEACGTSGVSPNEVCWSNCDAKSECGKDAAVPGQECPLNVCCGKWGFCGMTDDYCDVEDHGTTGGCQSNCDQPGPKDKADGQDRVIGYYEAWRFDSECQGMVSCDFSFFSLCLLVFSDVSDFPRARCEVA